MAVAQRDTEEIADIVREYMEPQLALEMLRKFRRTQAYVHNGSFRNTIERIYAAIKENLGK